jgi:hypothetical protein
MSRLVPLALLVVFLAVGPSSARAEPSFWSYAVSVPSVVSTSDGLPSSSPGAQGMHFVGAGPGRPLQGSQSIPLLTMTTINTDDASSFTFGNVHLPINVNVLALDSHALGSLRFTAMLNGTADYAHQTSTVAVTFAGSGTDSVVLSGNRYTFSMDPVQPLRWVPAPGPGLGDDPLAGKFVGSVSADVRVSPVNVTDSPEPSGLALAGVGVACAAGIVVQRRLRSGPLT